ncbi:MAG: DHH family phosphoesterase [Nitrososphaerales archaeon]|nr:DHH family phosphoesterase [Nitrososphaerales archaeon]
MPDLDGLLDRFKVLAGDLRLAVERGKRILVVTHIDADGLASGAVVFGCLTRMGADVAVRSIPDLDPGRIKELQGQNFDFYIFTDLASSLAGELESALDGRFLALDHHQIPDDDVNRPFFVNAWQYGYDGGKEACSTTMAYFLACAVDPSNRSLSYLPVVAAVADRQDSGPGRSLTGLNRRAVEEAVSAGLVSVAKGLVVNGRETRPVHESIALTSTPFMPSMSGNKDAVLAALLQSGLNLKDGALWRSASELSNEETMKVTEVIAGVLAAGGGGTDALAGLIGEVYTLEFEDRHTPLRDAREFATLLNSCGRMGAAGAGMALCLGDRREALKTGMKILSEYRLSINKAILGLTSDSSRVIQHDRVVLMRGEQLVDEKLLGPVTSIITSSPLYKDKIVVASASSGDSQIKISSRVGDSYAGSVNLGVVMREAAEAVKGVGGGHSMAAGAKIPLSEMEAFSKLVLEKIAA